MPSLSNAQFLQWDSTTVSGKWEMQMLASINVPSSRMHGALGTGVSFTFDIRSSCGPKESTPWWPASPGPWPSLPWLHAKPLFRSSLALPSIMRVSACQAKTLVSLAEVELGRGTGKLWLGSPLTPSGSAEDRTTRQWKQRRLDSSLHAFLLHEENDSDFPTSESCIFV